MVDNMFVVLIKYKVNFVMVMILLALQLNDKFFDIGTMICFQ